MQSNIQSSPTTAGPQAGEMLPYFNLSSSQGDTVNIWRYKGRRNLVVILAHDERCDVCRDVMRGFAERYRDYIEEETEVLGIVVASAPGVRRMAAELGLPFPLLADEDGGVHRKYGAAATATASGAAVFVADRFGEVQEIWLADNGHRRLPGHDEILERLRFIEILCPE